MRASSNSLAILLAASLALAISGLCVGVGNVAADPPAPAPTPAAPPAPGTPPAPRDSSTVVDVTIDDDGIQTKNDSGVTIDGKFGETRVRGKIEISEDGDTIIVHKSGPFRIESSTSDVVRMGSDITVGPEEVVQGDVVSIGGNVDVQGQVMGDAVAIGGMLHLAPTARVNGDAVSVGGSVEKDAGAEVNGETVSIGVPLPPFGPFAHAGAGAGHKGRITSVFAKIFILAMMAFFIFLALSFWREKVLGMARVIPERPWLMLMLGISVWILFVPACILLVISIVGILFLPVFIVLVFVGFILGLVTVYHFVGERFRGGAYAGRPFATTLLGLVIVHCFSILGAILGAIVPGLSPLPGALSIFGTMLAFFAATVGIGCVLHTRFGRRNMPLATPPETGTAGASADWGWTAPPPPPDLGPGRPGTEPPIPDVPKV